MLAAMKRFMDGMAQQPMTVRFWVAVLIAVNLTGLRFWNHSEGRMAVATLLAGGVLMIALTAAAGFSRLLGLGHVLWIPLLVWMTTRLPSAQGALRTWVIAVIVVNAISLLLDARDVVRYVRGERGELVSFDR